MSELCRVLDGGKYYLKKKKKRQKRDLQEEIRSAGGLEADGAAWKSERGGLDRPR